jgi:photosystem II stability/assembly factor-like uncharacterized protein
VPGQNVTTNQLPRAQLSIMNLTVTRKLLHLGLLGAGLLFALNFVYSASAQSWTQTSAPTNYWSAIACSADGSKMVAVAGSSVIYSTRVSSIYISTNYGSTWIQTSAPSNYWVSVAASADGTKLVSVAGSTIYSGPIYSSTDGGNTWTSNNIAIQPWRSVASSADGSKLFAVTSSGKIFISTNVGATWTSNNAPSGAWTIACSSDGMKLVAAPGNNLGKICTSTNAGKTWVTNNSPNSRWWNVASSSDGTRLAAVDGAGGPAHIYTSIDSGTTWVSNNVPLLSWQYISMSADGTKLVAAAWKSSGVPTGPIYTSTDSGLTWISNSVPNITWQGVACSVDGNEFMAVSAGNGISSQGTGGIWISLTTPSPQLNLAPSPTNLTLAWTIPSTNFVLQQSPDLSTWSNVTNPPILNYTNLQNQVSLPITNGSSFYRLTTP